MGLKLMCILGFILSVKSFAQDAVFTQFYAVPTRINPAFSGSEGNTRLGLGYRDQWMGSDYKLTTFYASADGFIESINSGFGISVLNQKESLSHYQFTQFNADYSYHIQLSENWAFFPGISFGYGFKRFDFSDLLLGDQIDLASGIIHQGNADPLLHNREVKFFDIAAGGVFYHENVWIGGSVKHLTQPNISFLEGEELSLQMFFSLHAGLRWRLRPTIFIPEASQLFFTLNYMDQGEQNRLDFGTEIKLAQFSFGVQSSSVMQKIISDTDRFITLSPILGFEFAKFKVAASYDFPLGNYSMLRGTGELTLQYSFANTSSRKRRWQVKR